MIKARSVAPMRTAKTGYIVSSVLLGIAGLLLICKPDTSLTVVGITAAIMMIVFGIIKIIGYFSKDLYRLAFEYDLAFGVLLIALGIIELVNPGTMMLMLCTTLGIAALADGLFKIQIAIKAKPFGIDRWWIILLLAVITAGIGITLLLNPGAAANTLMILLGVALMIDGALNLITVLMTVKIIKHQRPDIIEVEYKEIY